MDERLTRINSSFGRGASGHSNEENLSAKGSRGVIDSSSRIGFWTKYLVAVSLIVDVVDELVVVVSLIVDVVDELVVVVSLGLVVAVVGCSVTSDAPQAERKIIRNINFFTN